MKLCNFAIEVMFGVPFDYENWYEHMPIELTDEQFNRYCETAKRWETFAEWKEWNDENGEDFFIKRDLPDIYALIQENLVRVAPIVWDERINDYLDQINIYTADEIWHNVRTSKSANVLRSEV